MRYKLEMCLNLVGKNQFRTVKNQTGMGLPSALFLIVVLTLLLASMNQLNEVSSTAVGRDWLMSRAFYLAESGAQLSAVYGLNSDQALGSCDANFIQNQTFLGVGLDSCRLDVSCSAQNINSDIYLMFQSTGRCGTGLDEVSRTIEIKVRP